MDDRAGDRLGAVLRRRPSRSPTRLRRARPGRQHQRHFVSVPAGGLHRGPVLRPARLLVHLAADALFFPRAARGQPRRFRRHRLLHALVHRQGTEHDARAVDGGGRRLHLDVGGDARERRTLRQWALLGALAGFIALIRWQNALFALLPACDALALLVSACAATTIDGAARDADRRRVAFTACAVVGFLPQMLAWQRDLRQLPRGVAGRPADPLVGSAPRRHPLVVAQRALQLVADPLSRRDRAAHLCVRASAGRRARAARPRRDDLLQRVASRTGGAAPGSADAGSTARFRSSRSALAALGRHARSAWTSRRPAHRRRRRAARCSRSGTSR